MMPGLPSLALLCLVGSSKIPRLDSRCASPHSSGLVFVPGCWVRDEALPFTGLRSWLVVQYNLESAVDCPRMEQEEILHWLTYTDYSTLQNYYFGRRQH